MVSHLTKATRMYKSIGAIQLDNASLKTTRCVVVFDVVVRSRLPFQMARNLPRKASLPARELHLNRTSEDQLRYPSKFL